MAFTLNKNDVAFLKGLADYRIMTVRQIAALQKGNERSVRKRLKDLADSGHIETLPCPYLQGRGRPEGIYGIAKSGFDALLTKSVLPKSLSYKQVGWESLQHQVAHQLLLNWFRIHLEYLGNQAEDFSARFLSCNSPFALDPVSRYPLIRQCVTGHNGEEESRQQTFVPDAAFTIGCAPQNKDLLFFLEVDMDTESATSPSEVNKNVHDKILRYQACHEQKAYKRYETIWQISLNGFRLLFLAVNEKHMRKLCSTVRVTPPSDFVWVTCQEYLLAHGVSGNIWARGGRIEPGLQSILGSHSCELPILESPVKSTRK